MQKKLSKGGLYVIHFSTDIIKVGFSVETSSRVATQISKAWSLGVTTLQSWESEERGNAKQLETKLIYWCERQATELRNREYFKGLEFNSVVDYAKALIEESK